jgi:hypothetical protein
VGASSIVTGSTFVALDPIGRRDGPTHNSNPRCGDLPRGVFNESTGNAPLLISLQFDSISRFNRPQN